MSEPKAVLTAKRAGILGNYRHPWVFSNGLAKKPRLPAGTLVHVVSQDGRHLGMAFYHPDNAISLRMISFTSETIDREFWISRLRRAFALRKAALPEKTLAYRLAHGENDGLPGLTLDVYGDVIVAQSVCSGMEPIKKLLAEAAADLVGGAAVYERSEGLARKQEGLAPAIGWLVGERSFPVEIEEHGLKFEVDPSKGQKTGFFLDQRGQRDWVANYAKGLDVLDLFCYTGGFTLNALRGGALRALSLDASAGALESLQRNLQANGLDGSRSESRKADVFRWLKETPDRLWDLVIVDPPALAKSVHAKESGRNAYRALNRDAAKWVKSGGVLLTFSCSGVIDAPTFHRSVFLGLRDAHREGLTIERFGAGPDHPVSLRFPEGEYLKGLAIYIQE